MARILIVDDSDDLLELFSIITQRHGHQSDTATCKEELFTKLRTGNPDIVLLDVRLGYEDGRVVCKELKRLKPHLPIILLSGSPDMLQHYQEYGADDAIEKPFDMGILAAKIALHLQNMPLSSSRERLTR